MAAKDAPKTGEVLFCGMTDWKNVGRKAKPGTAGDPSTFPNIFVPTRVGGLSDVAVAAVCGGSAAAHCVAIAEDGRVFTWGRNENGQLGHGDKDDRAAPTEVKGLPEGVRVVGGSCGKSHTVVFTEEGDAWAWGSNKHGQLGVGGIAKTKPKVDDERLEPVQCAVTDCTAAACGAEFTMWICKGKLFSAGMPQYGQLGHGTDGEYNKADSSVKLAYEPQPTPRPIAALSGQKVIKVASGHNHTIAVDANGKFWTWGCGDYGRLGHREQKDVWSPKMVEFRFGDCPPDCIVAASQTTSWVTARGGQMYSFGKLKKSGDCAMYPVPFYDLQGWGLRSVACGQAIYAAAGDDQCITWGQGEGKGEIGQGEYCKSSANPKLVKSLGGKHVISVASGVGHTLFLLKKEDAEGLPTWSPKASAEDDDEPAAKKKK